MNANVAITNSGSGFITLIGNNSVTLTNSTGSGGLSTNGGAILVQTQQGSPFIGTNNNITSSGGNITIQSLNAASVSGHTYTYSNLNAGGGNILLNVAGNAWLSLNANATTSGTGGIQLTSGRTSGNGAAANQRAIYVGGNLTAGTGGINLTHTPGASTASVESAVNTTLSTTGNFNATSIGLITLGQGTNVTTTTGNINITGTGGVTINGNIAFSSNLSSTSGNISIQSNSSQVLMRGNAITGGAGQISLTSNRIGGTQGVDIGSNGNLRLTTQGGNITVNSPNSATFITNGNISSNGGAITLLAGNGTTGLGVQISNTVRTNTGGGNLTIGGLGNLSIASNTTLNAGTGDINLRIRDGGGTTFTAPGNITATNVIVTAFNNSSSLDLGTSSSGMIASLTNASASYTNLRLGNSSTTGNITGSSALNFGTRTAEITTTNNVSLTNAGNNFAGLKITAGNVALTEASDITQSGAWAVTGTTTLNAGTNFIYLNNAANDFGGAVSITKTGAGSVDIRDANALVIGASSNLNGTLSLTSNGDMTQTGSITQAAGAGAVTLNAGTGNVVLTNAANNFTGSVVATSTGATRSVSVRDVGDIVLGSISVDGNLKVQSGGVITQAGGSAIQVATGGVANFTTSLANTGNVTLDNTGTGATGTKLGVSTIGGSLQVTSNGTIDRAGTQLAGTFTNVNSSALTGSFSGSYNYTAGGTQYIGVVTNYILAAGTYTNNIDLTVGSGINFPTAYTGTAIQLNQANNILGTINFTTDANTSAAAGSVTITQAGAVTANGTVRVNATNGTLDWTTAGNDFQGALSIVNTGSGAVQVSDTNSLLLGDFNLGTGTLGITSGGAITQTSGGTITQSAGAATATFNAGSNSVDLSNVGNDFTGAVVINQTGGGSVQISDANSLTLGAMTLGTGTHSLKGGNGGAITQTGALTNNGSLGLGAISGANLATITLTNTANQLGTLSEVAASGAVQFKNNTGVVTLTNSLSAGSLTMDSGSNALTLNGTVNSSGLVDLKSTSGGLTVANTLNAGSLVLDAGNGALAINGAVTSTGTAELKTTGGGLTVANTVNGTDVTLNSGASALALNEVVTASGTLDLKAASISQTAQFVTDKLKVTTTGGDAILQNTNNQVATLLDSTTSGKYYLYDSVGGVTIGSAQTVAATGAMFLNSKGDITFASGSKLTSGSRVTLLTEGTFINQSGGDPFGGSTWRAYVDSTPTLGGITTTPATDKVALPKTNQAEITDPNTLPDPKSGELAAVYSIGSGELNIKPPILTLPSPPILEKREKIKEDDTDNKFVIKDVNKIIDVYESYLAGLGLDAAPVTEGELAATESSQIFGNTVTLNAPSPLFMLEAISVSIEVKLEELLQADLSLPVPVGTVVQNETAIP